MKEIEKRAFKEGVERQKRNTLLNILYRVQLNLADVQDEIEELNLKRALLSAEAAGVELLALKEVIRNLDKT